MVACALGGSGRATYGGHMVVELTQDAKPRDAAFEALTVFTREAYEKETFRNNAEAILDATHANGYFRYSIRMIKPIQKGEEILCTYGWDFHKRTTLAQGGPWDSAALDPAAACTM